MKRLMKFIVIILIFLLTLSIFTGFMTYDSGKNASNNTFSSEDLINKLSIQKVNRVKLSGSGVENAINSSFSSYNNSKFLYNGCSVVIYPNNKVFAKLYFTSKANGFKTSISFNFDFTFINEKMNIKITNVSVGKLGVPHGVLSYIVKNNTAKIKNISNTVTDVDASNLTFTLDLNSLISQNQKIFTIKNMSSESDNLILDLSINLLR